MRNQRTPSDDRNQVVKKGLSTYQSLSGAQKRDEMVKKHLKLVNFVASRLAIGLPEWVDKRDLVSSGVIGLIDACGYAGAMVFAPLAGYLVQAHEWPALFFILVFVAGLATLLMTGFLHPELRARVRGGA